MSKPKRESRPPTICCCPSCGDEIAIFGPHGRRECWCGWIGDASQVKHRPARAPRGAQSLQGDATETAACHHAKTHGFSTKEGDQ